MSDTKGAAGGDERTVPLGADGVPTDRLRLLVLGDGVNQAYDLPTNGQVTLGRSHGSSILLNEPSISRRHAVLEIGPALCIQDLGSANGVFVRRRRLAPQETVPIAIGEVVELGSVTIVVQQRAAFAASADAAPARGTTHKSASGASGASSASAGRMPAVVIDDPATRKVYDLLARIAASSISVLLLGETGAGKEVVAEAVHRTSTRSAGPFLRLNCATLSPSLLESELFGHERGAFTGAVAAKPGLLETAGGGTVFLDEVGELPLELQARLLRVLEERMVCRVGSLKPRPLDVRFVAATNRDLLAEIGRGAFRQDLYFRLNGISIEIPPLRERPGEIAPLAEMFAARSSAALGVAVPRLSPSTMALLVRYRWPGNVRELRNVLERAVLLCTAGTIEPEHLPDNILHDASTASMAPAASAGRSSFVPSAPMSLPPVAALPSSPAVPSDVPSVGSLPEALATFERQQITAALAQCGGNQTRAAEILGIPRRTLVSKLKVLGLQRRGDPDESQD